MTTTSNEQLTPPEKEKLFKTLQERFERNMERHPEVQWADVEQKLRLTTLRIKSRPFRSWRKPMESPI